MQKGHSQWREALVKPLTMLGWPYTLGSGSLQKLPCLTASVIRTVKVCTIVHKTAFVCLDRHAITPTADRV